jgi:hypothetical protein
MTLLSSFALWLAVAGAQPTPAAPEPPSLRITGDLPLPPELHEAKDVRWATDRSLFIANGDQGTIEIKLQPLGQRVRKLVAGRREPGGFSFSTRLGVSRQYWVVASSALEMTWRKVDDDTRYDEPVEFIHGIDVWRNRLLLVGARRDEKGEFAPDGAIAWIGSLDKKLADWKPLLYDAHGPYAPTMNACGSVYLGAARFLNDGSFVILPGVQPGLHFFDRNAKLVKTVDTVALGIDSDCGTLSKPQWERIAVDYPFRLAWVNQRRTVDTILALPEGPGLVVRSVENHHVRWRLVVVKADGTSRIYQLLVEAPDEYYHLRGDVRGGKMAFILFHQPPVYDYRKHDPPHLVTADAPQSEHLHR